MDAPFDHAQLHRDGFVLLRGAIPAAWLPALRDAFEQGAMPSHQWSPPRGADWRHSLLDLDPTVQAVCRLPAVLAAVGALVGETFFLSQIDGREPLAHGGHQGLHRDMRQRRAGDSVHALAFFDDYGPHNGATRLVPGTHRDTADVVPADEARAVQIEGSAGDILVFDSDLVHGGTRNPGGGHRRSILASYFAAPLYEDHLRTARVRQVRMDTSERFEPAGHVQGA